MEDSEVAYARLTFISEVTADKLKGAESVMSAKDRILFVSRRGNDLSKTACSLKDEYELVVAENVVTATGVLERATELIAMIIIDSEVSADDRINILRTAGKRRWTDVMPIILIADDIEDDQMEEFFSLGADDVICPQCSQVAVKNRVRSYIRLYHEKNILKATSVQAEQARYKAEVSQKDLRRKNQVLQFLGSIYSCVVYVNVENSRYLTMECAPHVKRVIGPEGYVRDGILESARVFSDDSSRDEVVKFADCSTLKERLRNRDMLTMEFHGTVSGVVRASIVAADRNLKGEVVHVIYILQDIGSENTAVENFELEA